MAPGARSAFLKSDPFVEVLTDLDIEFYDKDRQLSTEFTYSSKPPKPPAKKLTKKKKEAMVWAQALSEAGSKY